MAFGQFESVPVGILDESNFILTAGPVRLRFQSKFHSFRFELFAQCIEVGNVESDMAIPLRHLPDMPWPARFDQL